MTAKELRERAEAAEDKLHELKQQLKGHHAPDVRYLIELIARTEKAEQHAERLAESLGVVLDSISTFRVWFEDDYTIFVELPENDPLLEETARLGLTGRAEEALADYRKEYGDAR